MIILAIVHICTVSQLSKLEIPNTYAHRKILLILLLRKVITQFTFFLLNNIIFNKKYFLDNKSYFVNFRKT